MVPGGRRGQQIIIEDTRVCGYGIGLWVEGANTVDVNRSTFCRVNKAVFASGGRTTLRDNTIRASNIGVHVGAGQVVLGNNDFYGIRYAEVYREPGAPAIEAAENSFYSVSQQYCSWRRVDDGYWGRGSKRPSWSRRYEGRYYAPNSRNDYGECQEPQGSSFQDEAAFGYEDGGEAFYAQGDQYDGHAWPDPRQRVWGPYDRYDRDRDRYYMGGKASGECPWPETDWDRYRHECPPKPSRY